MQSEEVVGEVVSHNLVPGSFEAFCKNILELWESLLPGPIQFGSCMHEVMQSFFIKKLFANRATINVDFGLSSFPENLYFLGSLMLSSQVLSRRKMGSFL